MNNEIVNALRTIDSIERKLNKDSGMKTKDAIPDEKLRFWVKEVVLREFDSLGRKLNKIYDGNNKEVQFYIDSIQKIANTFKNKL